jgi:hypothetical protein
MKPKEAFAKNNFIFSRRFVPFLVLLVLLSCKKERPVNFPVRSGGAPLYAANSDAAAGGIDFSRPKKLDYRFGIRPEIPPPASLTLEYSFSAMPLGEDCGIVFTIGNDSWILPQDISFLAEGETGAAVFHYAIPVRETFPRQFSISLERLSPPGQEKVKRLQGQAPRFQIHSLEIEGRWYGFSRERSGGVEHFFTSPFVFSAPGYEQKTYIIDPPPEGECFELSVEFSPNKEAATASQAVIVRAEGLRYQALPPADTLYLPPCLISPNSGPVQLSGGNIGAFRMGHSAPPPFPEPIGADPGLILRWPQERWRERRFEVFRWNAFPSLLIFDTESYAVQDRLLKRLAFFTEKAGFRGRLASDAEIADLHGWNAHDYRAFDLANFFETARIQGFPLLDEERELEQILLNEGIIRRDPGGALKSGQGGIISISRESADYLRSLFMAHEGFHGLFFIDDEFRAFSRQRWLSLPRPAKVFINSFFAFQRYDTGDEYLMVNELMAHVLQQPASRAGVYFGETLPRRIEASSPWRQPTLGEKDQDTDSWPHLAEAFTQEARAFSDYVHNRWGLSAGRVWMVIMSSEQ